jgi:hypothetical protein
MKRRYRGLTLITIGLYVLSGFSFFIAFYLQPLPIEIFRLQFNPLNVTTNAIVDYDDETIAFDTLNQTLTVSSLPIGLLKVTFSFSGSFLTNESADEAVPFLLTLNQVTIPLNLTTTPTMIVHGWFHSNGDDLILQFVNFVKIEGQRIYGVYLESLTIHQSRL